MISPRAPAADTLVPVRVRMTDCTRATRYVVVWDTPLRSVATTVTCEGGDCDQGSWTEKSAHRPDALEDVDAVDRQAREVGCRR